MAQRVDNIEQFLFRVYCDARWAEQAVIADNAAVLRPREYENTASGRVGHIDMPLAVKSYPDGRLEGACFR